MATKLLCAQRPFKVTYMLYFFNTMLLIARNLNKYKALQSIAFDKKITHI